MKYVLEVYSKRYGLLDTETYEDEKKAKLAGGRSIKNHFHHDYYTITLDGEEIARDEFGYSRYHVLRDFRCYAKCCRDEVGAWEFSAEGFRWFIWYEYIVPSETFLDLECGRYTLTDKFREVGLIVRNGGLPPEYEQASTQHPTALPRAS